MADVNGNAGINSVLFDVTKLKTDAASDAEVSPVRVSQEDRLRIENLQLKLDKVHLEITLTTQQLMERTKLRGELVSAFQPMREEYMTKYGIDLLAGKIEDDGTFKPGKKNVASGG